MIKRSTLFLAFAATWTAAYAATVINTTPVLKTDDDDDGIAIFEDDSVIENSSTVTTQGMSADGLRIDGLNARILNADTGVIVTEGDNFAVGIRLGRETATVENAGSVTTSGINGDGIVLLGGDGLVTNSGSVLVQGAGADGFVVEGDNTTLINTGSFRSTGGVRTADPSGNEIYDDATGVFLAGSNNTLINEVGAEIVSTGFDANTVNAWLDSNIVTNRGLISAVGEDSIGISVAINNNGVTTVNNQGTIQNTGPDNGLNLFSGTALANLGSQFSLSNQGQILSSSANGKAIASSAGFSSGQRQVNLTNSGLISASGTDSVGTILLYGGEQTLNNLASGVIEQQTAGQPAIVNASDGTQIVSNAGMISGDVLLGPDDDSFEIVDEGMVVGTVNGEDGTDRLTIATQVPGSADGAGYRSFEIFEKRGPGRFTAENLWDFGATGTGRINEGEFCLADASELIAGVLVVEAEATLCGTGTLSALLLAEAGSTISPGFSPGVLTINGDLSAEQATIRIEVTGPGAGDTLTVTGDAAINEGTLEFVFVDGYLPRAGDSLTWLTADGTVAFNAVSLEASGVGEGFEFEVQVDGEGLEFVASNNALPPPEELVFSSGFETPAE